MPRIIDLGKRSERLEGINIIIGEGLCSNIYVVGKKEATIIDTGVGNWANPVWPQLEELGVKANNIMNIILTHAHHDHAMGTFLILKKVKAKTFVHTKDTKYIATSLGDNLIKAEEGDVIDTEIWPLEVYWTPGHTEGSMVLYERERKILFSGDTVFPNGNFGRYDGESGSYEKILSSLEKLKALDVETLLAGHGMPVIEGANEHILLSYMNASRYQ